MYIMFPNYTSRTNLKSEAYKFFRNKFKGETIKDTIENLRSVFPEIEDEQIAEVLQSNETRVEFVKNSFDELVQYVLDNKSKPEVKAIIDELDIKITGLNYVSSNSNSEKALQNRIIELYKSMLLHPDNINKIMTPLDHVHIKNDAINLNKKAETKNLDMFDFLKDIDDKYSFIAGEAGVGQIANAFVDYAMGSITDYSIKGLYEFDKSGKDIFKNQGKVNSKLDMVNSVTLSDKDLTDYFTEFSKYATEEQIEELKKNLENFRTIPISDTFSALMNAFVDIQKDPFITDINWNTMTTNTGVLLVRMGVHPFYVNALFAQPIIKEYIEFTSSYESNEKEEQTLKTIEVFFKEKVSKNLQNITFKTTNGNEVNAKFLYDIMTSKSVLINSGNINNALRQVLRDELDIRLAKDETLDSESLKALNEYHDSYFNTDKFNNALDWDLKNLRNEVFEPSEKKQQNILKTFLTFQGKAKKSIKPFVDASKHSVNGVGKDSTQLLMALNRIQNISKSGVVGYNNKMYYEDGTPKLLGHYYENNLLGTAKIIQANPTLFISANQNIWNTYNIISEQIYGESLNNQELADKLEKTFYSYLMSGFGPFNLKGSEINNIVNNFPSELLDFKVSLAEREENYYILDELQTKIVKPKATGQNQLKLYIPNKKNSKEYDNKMMNSFKEILKYYPEIGKKLIQYSFFTSGFNLGADTFYQYIPPTFFIENGFNEYVKEYNRNLNKEDLNFIDQFYLSNLTDRQVVRNINFNPKNVDSETYKDIGVLLLDVNDDRYITGKYFVNTVKTTDQNGQSTKTERYYKMLGYLNGKVVLSPYVQSQLGYARISSININDRGGYRQLRLSQDKPILATNLDLQERIKPRFEEIMNNLEFEQLEVEQVNTEIETKQEVKSEVNNNIIFEEEQSFDKIKDKWKSSGRTKEEWDLMSLEEREHVIKNCL